MSKTVMSARMSEEPQEGAADGGWGVGIKKMSWAIGQVKYKSARLAREPMKEIVRVDKAPTFITYLSKQAAGKQFLPIDTTTQILRLRHDHYLASVTPKADFWPYPSIHYRCYRYR